MRRQAVFAVNQRWPSAGPTGHRLFGRGLDSETTSSPKLRQRRSRLPVLRERGDLAEVARPSEYLRACHRTAKRVREDWARKQRGTLYMFRYFLGPVHEMSDLVDGDAVCSLCGRTRRCFRLESALCSTLAADARGSAVGCIECLQQGRFEFWHDTEIGVLDENGLTHVYKHNQPPPEDFPPSALIELRRTPQIVTWQQELWLAHCNDFMAYIGTWEPRDFHANTVGGDGRLLFLEMTDKKYQHLWDVSLPPGATRLESWHATFYAFRCLHCGKLRGNWDCD